MAAAQFTATSVRCEDLATNPASPKGAISTGIGFLDHMIDQLNSHAQVRVSVVIDGSSDKEENEEPESKKAKVCNGDDDDDETKKKIRNTNRFAGSDEEQDLVMRLVGEAIGAELKQLLEPKDGQGRSSLTSTSRFCCPLDEALVACRIERRQGDGDGKNGGSNGDTATGRLESFTLPPYGKFPSPMGRTRIGSLSTSSLRHFWEGLAEHSGLIVNLDKVRGDNAHHVVESAFKAFSRALRNLLDGVDTNVVVAENGGKESQLSLELKRENLRKLYGPNSANWGEGIAQKRMGSHNRETKETSISTTLRFDGGEGDIDVSTGVATLDEFFALLAQEAEMSLNLRCRGDLWIDDHHTAEDVAIAVGQVLTQALGTKAGLNRMWCAAADDGEGDAEVEVTMDLSNRPCFTHNLTLSDDTGKEMIGDLSFEMFEHILDSLVVNAKMTVHIVELRRPRSHFATVKAVATSFGRALRYCAMVDSRRCGATASSKGTLSV